MNKEEPVRDQAERLRQRISKKDSDLSKSSSTEIGSLPPRSTVHKKSKKKKAKFNLKYPIIRLLVLFFVLLPIVIYSMCNSHGKIDRGENTKTAITDRDDYETVRFEEENNQSNGEGESEVKEEQVEEDQENHIEDNRKINQIIDESKAHSTNGKNDKDTATERETNNTGNEGSKDENVIYHQVQPNESLYKISMKYFRSPSRIEVIKKANGIKTDEIQAGQTLKIPLDEN